MAIKEQHAKREVIQNTSGINATRVWLVDWADRYLSGSGTEPHRLPYYNEAHPDYTLNAEMKKCKMIDRKISEMRAGTDGAGPLKCLITCKYSTRPTGVIAITANTLSFADTDPDTILDSGSGFEDAGFLPGLITVSGSANNDGSYTIDTGGVAAGVLTLVGGDVLVAEGAGNLITITQRNRQLIKTIQVGADAFMVQPNNDWKFEDQPQELYTDHIAIDVPVGILIIKKVVDVFPWDDVRPLYGTVNNATFYGATAGKMLFEGADVDEERDESGDSTWRAIFTFKYRSIEWNKFWYANKTTVDSGTITGQNDNHLLDGGADFVNDGVKVGHNVYNATDKKWAKATAVAATDITLDANIFPDNDGDAYKVGGAGWSKLKDSDGNYVFADGDFTTLNVE